MSDRVDLNCDMGESFGAYRIGADDDVFPFITSANVACGFHGGDPRSCARRSRARGATAWPSARIRAFRTSSASAGATWTSSPQEVYDLVVYQIGALLGFARAAKVELQHVKAHGALYNMAAAKPELAAAIARAVRDVDRSSCCSGCRAAT